MPDDIKLTPDFDFDLEADGTANTVTGADAIDQDIRVLLSTERGSHFIYPDLGVDRRRIIESSSDEAIAGAIDRAIRQNVTGIASLSVEVRSRDRALGIVNYVALLTGEDGLATRVEGVLQ